MPLKVFLSGKDILTSLPTGVQRTTALHGGVLTPAKASPHAPTRSQLPTGSTCSKNLTGQLTDWGN